ncbi:hypothetical protein KUCAC02_033439 [Chaenocephalus aceratus]|nr:hypothetical protein KUCAC02_033439 [Chaenocephalus aceratus]
MELRKVQGRAAEAPKGAAAGGRSVGVLEWWRTSRRHQRWMRECWRRTLRAAMIFGNPKNEQRGCGTGRNGRGKRTSAENAGQSDRCKEDKEREMEKRRASSTEGELGKGISLRRFRGRHTYDAIATELEDIFSQYGFTNDKVTACVTDNGSNFVKAFKEHQQRQFESDEEEHEVDVDCEADFTDLHSVPPPKMIMPGTGYVYCLPISNDHWAA